MVIRFVCPNGHPIHCPDSFAGRVASCPKCNTKFRVPAQATSSAAGVQAAEVPSIRPTDSGIEAAARAPKDEETFEFLCPNGHRLQGLLSLQGRPGECPECGARFRVPFRQPPSPDEEEKDEAVTAGQQHAGPPEGSTVDLQERDLHAEGEEEDALEIPDIEEPPPSKPRPHIPPPDDSPSTLGRSRIERMGVSSPMPHHAHTIAELFAELWAQKEQDGRTVVELHLSNGEVVAPDRFARSLSQGTHGMFAVEQTDGTHSLETIAWDMIVRVVVRGQVTLPEEMGE